MAYSLLIVYANIKVYEQNVKGKIGLCQGNSGICPFFVRGNRCQFCTNAPSNTILH